MLVSRTILVSAKWHRQIRPAHAMLCADADLPNEFTLQWIHEATKVGFAVVTSAVWTGDAVRLMPKNLHRLGTNGGIQPQVAFNTDELSWMRNTHADLARTAEMISVRAVDSFKQTLAEIRRRMRVTPVGCRTCNVGLTIHHREKSRNSSQAILPNCRVNPQNRGDIPPFAPSIARARVAHGYDPIFRY